MKRMFDLRFILTPFATVIFDTKKQYRKYYYVFGFKVCDLSLMERYLPKEC